MHYTDFKDPSAAMVGFSQYVREEGLTIGIEETLNALRMVTLGLWKSEPYFRFSLASIFCIDLAQRQRFDALYDHFWKEKGTHYQSKTQYKNHRQLQKQNRPTLAMQGFNQKESDRIHRANTMSGAHKMEVLRTTDFALLTEINDEILDNLCQQLVREMSLRIRRKYKKGRRALLDVASTIRNGIQYGGHFVRLQYKQRQKEKLRLIMLLDVSGSMDKYSFFLLRFIYELRTHFKGMEVFTFSSRLKRITPYLKPHNLVSTLKLLSHHNDHWSSGTKIGDCLSDFNERYAKQMLNGRSITIILSDGLDTGDPNKLSEQLRRIKLRTKHLVWLNPLKGMSGYQPIQRGMQAALEHLDVFDSAHNLQSLLTLEEIISHA